MLSGVQLDAVPSEYVPLSILYHRLMAATDVNEQRELRDSLIELLQVFFLIYKTCTCIQVYLHTCLT